jgi:hypothetical protein
MAAVAMEYAAMMIGSTTSLALAVLASVSAAPPSALAGDGRGPAGKPPHVRIDEIQARRIAWEYGIIRIEEIALSGSRWEIAGRGSEDEEMALDIDAHSGAVSR